MKTYSRPKFVREESWRYKRVKPAWRSPRGKTSRVRRSKKGWPPVVKIGYSKPNQIRGLHPSGLREVIIQRVVDLEKLTPKQDAARIAHTVGENKRLMILEEADRRDIRVLNPGPKKEPAVTEPAIEEPAPETTKVAKTETSPAAESKTDRKRGKRRTK